MEMWSVEDDGTLLTNYFYYWFFLFVIIVAAAGEKVSNGENSSLATGVVVDCRLSMGIGHGAHGVVWGAGVRERQMKQHERSYGKYEKSKERSARHFLISLSCH
jgi:hypothetical protein